MTRPRSLPEGVPIPIHALARHLRELGRPEWTTKYTRRFLFRKLEELRADVAKGHRPPGYGEDMLIHNGRHYSVSSLAIARQYIPGLGERRPTYEELQNVLEETREALEAAKVRERQQNKDMRAMQARMREMERTMDDLLEVVDGLVPKSPQPETQSDPWSPAG